MNPLNHYSFEAVPTIFDEEALTVLELCARLASKVNELIKGHNDQDELIKALYDSELTKQVSAWLEAHPEVTTTVQDGELTLAKFVMGEVGFITPQLFGAVGDGFTDDTASILSAVALLGDKVPALYFPPGTYMVSQDIMLPGNVTVFGAGRSSIIKKVGTNSPHYTMMGASEAENIVIKDLRFIGDRDYHDGTTGEWGHVLAFAGCHNVTIQDCAITNGWGDGIYIGYLNGECKNFTIDHCLIDNNRRNGVSVIACDGFHLNNSTITNTNGTAPEAGIDFEPNKTGEVIRNCYIDNCHFEGNANYDVCYYDNTEPEFTVTNTKLLSRYGFYSSGGVIDAQRTGKGICFKHCHFDNAKNCVNLPRKSTLAVPIRFRDCDFYSDNVCIQFGGSDLGFEQDMGAVHFEGCYVGRNLVGTPFFRFQNAVTSGKLLDVVADFTFDKSVPARLYLTNSYSEVKLTTKGAPRFDTWSRVDINGVNCWTDIGVYASGGTIDVVLYHSIPIGCPIKITKADSNGAINISLNSGSISNILSNGAFTNAFTLNRRGATAILTHMGGDVWTLDKTYTE